MVSRPFVSVNLRRVEAQLLNIVAFHLFLVPRMLPVLPANVSA
jgi:hypothetical protein